MYINVNIDINDKDFRDNLNERVTQKIYDSITDEKIDKVVADMLKSAFRDNINTLLQSKEYKELLNQRVREALHLN